MTDPNPDPKPSRPQAGVPRRFSVGVLMVMVTMYAVLFAILRTLDTHPAVFIGVALFFTVIGVAQAAHYGGKDPRKASVLTGAWLGAIGWAIGLLWESWPPDLLSLLLATLGCGYGAVFGGMLGYFAGLAIAAVFLWVGREKPATPEILDD